MRSVTAASIPPPGSFFDPSLFEKTGDRETIGGYFSDLVEAGVIPRTVTRLGFTIDIVEQFHREISKATDEQMRKAVELARKRFK